MKTEFENLQFISEYFKKVLQELMKNGFTLIIPEPTKTFRKTNYAYFSDGDKIAYLQQESKYREISISSVHKPSKEVGTGFRLSDEYSLEMAKQALVIICPTWAINSRNHVIKYENLKEFMKSGTQSWHQLNIYPEE
ncbi:hypothetical protein DRF65_20800 [Chryseobacterium pennae]|uniref:Uncharacterized protein n=1 Tax=Chryseobacterium pennae TaxID=2258962 RepID=A0A3D9C401_9FLAO|nr:hypothetical protein [Chryseobacterium pennae]REC60504.1 hypothetical protein DRF65_20800 [Chryseobacterium pennae]